jgi:predicted metalloprotease with PDZ domain
MPLRRALVALAFLPALSAAVIRYSLTPEPEDKSVRITISIEHPNSEENFRIPAWCPGFYFLEKYEENISDFKAVDPEGTIFKVDHSQDKRLWTISDPAKKPITVSYRVLGNDPGLGFFGTNVLAQTAFVNGASAFMFVDGRLTEPTNLQVKVPEGWKVATAADPTEDGGFKAGGYDELIDHPIQMGHFEVRKFVQGGIPFQVVFVSKDQQYRPDMDAETERLKAIALPALKLFGGAQFKRYIFFIHLAVGNFNGGLEHRACNVQAIANTRPLNIDDLAAHEYFHAWNVKQIRPKVLGPFDYTREQRTGNLWFSEGVTDYYAKITTYRSGLQDLKWLLNDLSGQIGDLQRGQARHTFTVADASRQAWEYGGFGLKDLSYYTKGLLIGWILDAVIRDATDGEKSLDDVMRLMYKRYQLPNPGFEENGIIEAVNEVAGIDLSRLCNQMINSTLDLPYDLLEKIGINVDPATGVASVDQRASARVAELRNAWLERPGGIR